MNHIYRSIWNAKTGTFVAVSEAVKSGGKSASSGAGVVGAGFTLKALAVSLLMAFGANLYALPVDGVVAAGSATITSGTNSMTVNQSSQNVALNWQSFNIGQGQSVNFVQPNSSAVALNRVLGADPSSILGSLNANGKVFLVNPNGILFGQGASVNVGGLVASTLNITDSDFMAGRYKFAGTGGTILNQGSISADGGYVALLGANVSNQGVIAARLGTVALAAGSAVTLDVAGDGLIKVAIDQGAVNALVDNGGMIRADGGHVLLSAQAAGDLLHTVVNNTGIVQAQTIENRNGTIRLLGDNVLNSGNLDASGAGAQAGGRIDINAGYATINTGTLNASGAQGGQISVASHNLIEAGQYDASGTNAGGSIALIADHHIEQTTASTLTVDGGSGTGGSIRIEAGHDAWLSGSASASGRQGGAIAITAPDLILAGARLDATGEAGGGVIRVGGGWQGGDADLANANRTRLVDTDLDVSATINGNGGTAVVWSEQETLFGGAIKATGGALGGDGGQVEISSHDRLGFGGTVDASALNGANGRLLLDPKNIEIVESVSGINILSLVDPTPSANESLGTDNVVELLNNGVSIDRIVVASKLDDTVATDAGAVRLYDSQTGALISTLTGSTSNDQVGSNGVIALSKGNYVVRSQNWDNGTVANAGAVTWGSGTTGVAGAVSATNSLVGSTATDGVGSSGVTALTNGNYLVRSPFWNNGMVTDAGAVTWGSGTTGVVGAISASNSLVGSKSGDRVGSNAIIILSNGNYVVRSHIWDNGTVTNAGAATWGSGTTGVVGEISAANSLVGTRSSDTVGGTAIVALSNGNYVVVSSDWDNGTVANAGAVTWGNGTTGVVGEISASNSLVGSTTNDYLGTGSNSLTALSNGNYVVRSQVWDNGTVVNAGAVTLGNGTTGVVGAVSAANSLVGTTAEDRVGNGDITELSNGNYLVRSTLWDNASATDAGAVTWGSGTTGVAGAVSATNSLVGSTSNDQVGVNAITTLSNGNYVVRSNLWDNGTVVDAGAVTWGSGTTGVVGAISAINSLVGSTASDQVGNNAITALSNGNYVVRSHVWDNGTVADAGAVTWASGTTGVVGAVSATNSLIGSTLNDRVGINGITELNNGNYVVGSQFWGNGTVANAGAVTWGSGTTGVVGAVSATNSLVGSTMNDYVSNSGVTALSNGNYVVRSQYWDNGTVADAGAVTWASGTTGVVGAVSATNSLVGSTMNDQVGNNAITALSNGNYVVRSQLWDNGTVADAGAVTWSSGTTGVVGAVSATNSLVGSTASDSVGNNDILELSNGNYVVRSQFWDNASATDAGAVTWGSGTTGVVGAVSATNSLVGSTMNDQVGSYGIIALSNGNYVVRSQLWDNGTVADVGAVTWASGTTGVVGAVSTTNSLVGSTMNDQVGSNGIIALSGGNYVVRSQNWVNGTVANAGAVTWSSGTTGLVGAVSAINSLVGSTSGDAVGNAGISELSDGRVLVRSSGWDAGGVVNAGRVDIISGLAATTLTNPHTFVTNPGGTSTLLASDLTALLNAGTAVTLQANNDITVSTAITANNAGGDGGHLSLQVGRSILLNANITTDNGNLTLTGNDTVANGVIDAHRDAGAAAITMAPGTSINAGTGNVTITLRDGAGLTNSTSGNIDLRDISAANISAVNAGATAGSGVVLNGTLSASANSGDGIVLAGKTFINNTGATALSSSAGSRWLVWSGDPANDTRGALGNDFKQYNANYGSTTVLGAGNGFLYTLAPTITASLTGAVSKTYDGTDNATLAAGNYSVSGAVDGDTVTLNNPASGTYDSKNVGTGKTVTASGLSMASASNNGVAVYGYQMASTAASADIGTITRLSSVTWVGGTTGNWFDAANWAGGAVPDLANVANVIIPAGVTVSFDSGNTVLPAQAGAVNVDTLGSAGSLQVVDGSLNVATSLQLGSLEQSGGTLNSGTIAVGSFTQSGGTLTSSGNLTVSDAYSQSGSGASVDVGGNTGIAQSSGSTLLGNLTTAGTLEVNAVNGSITQLAGTSIAAAGAVTLSAPNGKVTLANSGNSLGAVTVSDSSSNNSNINSPGIVVISGANDTRLQNALARAVSMEGMNMQGNVGATSSTAAQPLVRLPSRSTAAGILDGLNVTLVGQGVKLPPGVQPDDANDDEK